MELMNQARRLKRIRKEAAAAGQAAAEAAVPSKKIKFLEQDTGGKGKGKGAAVLGIDSGGGDSDDANADINPGETESWYDPNSDAAKVGHVRLALSCV